MIKLPSHEQLQIFSTIAELGSFSAAGKKLNIPATTIGRRISELEEALGVRLFHRSTRSCSLSSDGQYYLSCFAGLIEELERTTHALTQMQDEATGVLKVTAPVSVGIKRLQPLVSEYMANNPKVDIHIFLKNEYIDLVADGYDIGIRLAPLKDSNLIARKLGAIYYFYVASPQFLNRFGTPLHPRQCANFDCIGLCPELKTLNWQFQNDTERLEVTIKPKLVVNDPAYALNMALSDSGIACLPDFHVEKHLASGALVNLFPHWHAHSREIYAVYHDRKLLSPAVKEFLSLLHTLNFSSQLSQQITKQSMSKK